MNKAKRKVHNFNFKSEGAHVALVDAAANLQTVLSMKAAEKEVTISMTMKEFLKKFFGLWEEEAAVLAGVLGYEHKEHLEDMPSDYDGYILEQIEAVSLLKGKEIPDTLPESIALKVEELIKNFDSKLTSEGSPLETKTLKGDSKLSKDNSSVELEELETLKAQVAEMDALKAQVAEMETIKSQLEDMRKAAKEQAKREMTELVKGYSFIPEESQEGVVDFLLKSENNAVILTVLEKARDAISSAVVEKEAGVEAGDLDIDQVNTEKQASNDLVTNLLKARHS